jgi:hypothetical protein
MQGDAWVDKVVRLNPEPDLAQMAEALCGVIIEQARTQRERVTAILSLS